MDDRTLLLKAARAYWGTEIDDVVSVEWSDEDQSILYTHADNQDHNGLDRTYRWNSLEEDDDALLLAVKLRMRVQIDDYGAAARIGDKGTWHGFEAHMHGGIEAATRRAITCAAAAMADEGGEMKFEFVEFNPRRAQRGAEAAQVMVTDDQGEEHLLWMSRSDITRNMMAFGRCDALTQAQTAYAAMDKGGDHVDR